MEIAESVLFTMDEGTAPLDTLDARANPGNVTSPLYQDILSRSQYP